MPVLHGNGVAVGGAGVEVRVGVLVAGILVLCANAEPESNIDPVSIPAMSKNGMTPANARICNGRRSALRRSSHRRLLAEAELPLHCEPAKKQPPSVRDAPLQEHIVDSSSLPESTSPSNDRIPRSDIGYPVVDDGEMNLQRHFGKIDIGDARDGTRKRTRQVACCRQQWHHMPPLDGEIPSHWQVAHEGTISEHTRCLPLFLCL